MPSGTPAHGQQAGPARQSMSPALVHGVPAEVIRRDGRRHRSAEVRLDEARPDVGSRRALGRGKGSSTGRYGLFSTVDEAVSAATEAQRQLGRLSLDDRDSIVTRIKSMATAHAVPWGALEFEETKIGRLEHKIEKLQIAASGSRRRVAQDERGERIAWPLPRGVRALRRDRRGHAGHPFDSDAFGQRHQHDRCGQRARLQPAPRRRSLRRPTPLRRTTGPSPNSSGSST